MASEFSFKFDTTKFKSPKIMDRKLNRAIFGVCRYYDGRVESSAKKKAPWKDRTTNARNGLFAQAAKLGGTGFASNSFAIILAHSVTYGIYLELPHTHERADGTEYTIGPFPIIMPTLEEYGPKVVKTLRKILDRLGS
jgi:hypothetical protein